MPTTIEELETRVGVLEGEVGKLTDQVNRLTYIIAQLGATFVELGTMEKGVNMIPQGGDGTGCSPLCKASETNYSNALIAFSEKWPVPLTEE